MERVGRREAMWCVACAWTIVGPYLLGAHGNFDELPVSGAYGFVAFGLLVGLWVTSYPAAAVAFRGRMAHGLCMGGALFILGVIGAFGLFRFAYTQVLSNDFLNSLFMTDSGMAYAWVLDVLGWCNAIALYEKPLVFLAAVLCGVSCPARRLTRTCQDGAIPRQAGLLGAALLACLCTGILRSQVWTALCGAPVSLLVVWAGVLLWLLHVILHAFVRPSVAALCAGELAFRLVSRFNLPMPLHAFDLPSIPISALCLGFCCFACVRLSRGVRDFGRPCDIDADAACAPVALSLQAQEKAALAGAGLTPREIDVIEASLDGRSSQAAADALGMQASTVRSYKGRICKKIGLDSFDQVLAMRSARRGVFELQDGRESGTFDGVCSGEDCKRFRCGASIRLFGLLGLLLLVLMPSGQLTLCWDATWVMAYGCAVGMMLSCVPHALCRLGLCAAAGGMAGRGLAVAAPFLFVVFSAACLAFRMLAEYAGLPMGAIQQAGLFVCVAGLVCLGIAQLRFCIASSCFQMKQFGLVCSCAAILVGLAGFSCIVWVAAVVASLVCYAVGVILCSGTSVVVETQTGAVHALSWFAIAFVWEESWRGVSFASIQDVGIVCMIGLAILNLRTLRECAGTLQIPPLAMTLVGIVLTCFGVGVSFGLVMGVIVLEVQSLRARCLVQAPSEVARNHAPASPPSVLGAAVGCCAAVYIVNARGSYILLNAGSILPDNLDWASLACFGASLAILVFRCLYDTLPVVPDVSRVGRAQLGGYLVGKGLNDNEVAVCVSLAQGCSVAQAAETLHYSVSHADAIKRSAFSKLHVRTRRGFIALLWVEFGQTEADNFKTSR